MARQIQITRTQTQAEAGQVVYAIDDNLGYLVNRATRLMAQTFSRRLQRHGVAPAQWAILLFLYARDGQTQRELSWVVAIEPPTAWSAVSRTLTTSAHPYPADPASAGAARATRRGVDGRQPVRRTGAERRRAGDPQDPAVPGDRRADRRGHEGG